MPLTSTGMKIMRRMIRQYGAKKGRSVFYAMENKGKLTKKALKRKSKRRRK